MHKSRFIHEPQLSRDHRVIPIPKGGHDGVTAPEGADNINLLTNDMVNQALGVAGSDVNNYLNVSQIPAALMGSSTVNVEGLTSLEINQQATYFITDYESFATYVVAAIRGTVVRSGNLITYTAPATVGAGGFVINGRQVNIPITSNFSVTTPVITSPVNNATGLSTSPSFVSNAFAISGTTDTHEGSDWQVATDAGFTNIVSQVTNSATNKLDYSAAGLTANTTYHVRVRYKGTIYGYSAWSAEVAFTTQVASTVNQPTISSPSNGAQGVATSPSFTSTAFVVSSGTDTHEGSDWQIATDAGFTSIVAQTTNSAVNKTTYSIAGLSGGVTYYARVRYKGTAYGYSSWSPSISFTTSAVAAYGVTPTTSTVNEGSTITFNISTSNVANGTTLYWTINGNNVTSGDFTSGGISGSVTINSNAATVVKTLTNDTTTEGIETFVFNLRTVSVTGTIVANSGTITVNDISLSPNTAPLIGNLIENHTTTLNNDLALYTAVLPETITVSDTQLDAIGDWSGSSVTFLASYYNITGNDLDFDKVVTATGGAITFVMQNISGQNKYLVKHNNVAIGEYIRGSIGTGEITINFGTTVSKSVGAAIITNTHVKDTLIAIGFKIYNGSQAAINFIDNSQTGVLVTVTLKDGNTGSQGNGGNLSTDYNVLMCAPAGYETGVGCTYDKSYVTFTANGTGGSTISNTITNSINCGIEDLVLNAYAQTTNKIILSTNDGGNTTVNEIGRFKLARLNTDGSLDTSFGTSGIFRYNTNASTVKNIRLLSDNKIATVIDNKVLIISANGVQQSLTNNKPTGYSNSTIEDIVPISATEILVFGYYNPNGGDYRGIIYKINASGIVDNSFAVYLTPTGTGNYPGISGFPRIKFNSSNNSLYLYIVDYDYNINNAITKFNYNINNVTLDTAYGTSGTATFANFAFENIIFQANNKILVFERDRIMRLNLDGTKDSSFGILANSYTITNGYLAKSNYNSYGDINDVKVLSDTSLLVLWKGSLQDPVTYETKNYISKLTNTGIYDTTYGNNGLAELPVGMTIDDVYPKDRMVIVSDLPIVCRKIASGNRSYKFLANGNLDGSYI